jgi:hypothetical protein
LFRRTRPILPVRESRWENEKRRIGKQSAHAPSLVSRLLYRGFFGSSFGFSGAGLLCGRGAGRASGFGLASGFGSGLGAGRASGLGVGFGAGLVSG